MKKGPKHVSSKLSSKRELQNVFAPSKLLVLTKRIFKIKRAHPKTASTFGFRMALQSELMGDGANW
jgi:hypothetical protein